MRVRVRVLIDWFLSADGSIGTILLQPNIALERSSGRLLRQSLWS